MYNVFFQTNTVDQLPKLVNDSTPSSEKFKPHVWAMRFFAASAAGFFCSRLTIKAVYLGTSLGIVQPWIILTSLLSVACIVAAVALYRWNSTDINKDLSGTTSLSQDLSGTMSLSQDLSGTMSYEEIIQKYSDKIVSTLNDEDLKKLQSKYKDSLLEKKWVEITPTQLESNKKLLRFTDYQWEVFQQVFINAYFTEPLPKDLSNFFKHFPQKSVGKIPIQYAERFLNDFKSFLIRSIQPIAQLEAQYREALEQIEFFDTNPVGVGLDLFAEKFLKEIESDCFSKLSTPLRFEREVDLKGVIKKVGVEGVKKRIEQAINDDISQSELSYTEILTKYSEIVFKEEIVDKDSRAFQICITEFILTDSCKFLQEIERYLKMSESPSEIDLMSWNNFDKATYYIYKYDLAPKSVKNLYMTSPYQKNAQQLRSLEVKGLLTEDVSENTIMTLFNKELEKLLTDLKA